MIGGGSHFFIFAPQWGHSGASVIFMLFLIESKFG
ncbi:hypothetical protein FGF66_04785 [Chlorobaculum thiosulfatiphilum]|uniref:Uncharacterized protein n=1 Tax=Chlorobaculum thiosulfatiphilum TaxID=115852 RepID=A0A5C4S839_CHLTI|nr:hypothetical protein FGF66_04785 [Chlorobaculum thiosulfatiphilum]